jgi:hypothetical protein
MNTFAVEQFLSFCKNFRFERNNFVQNDYNYPVICFRYQTFQCSVKLK